MQRRNDQSGLRVRRWSDSRLPRRILSIRLQALGDIIITLPYLQSLKRQFPNVELHLLTRTEFEGIPNSMVLFDRVITIGGGRNTWLQLAFAIMQMPILIWQSYDAVLDLQNNFISVLLRRMLRAKAWCEFDRYSLQSAGERTRLAIEALAGWRISLDTRFQLNIDVDGLLTRNNWKRDHDIILLNPAGHFPSRNWPWRNYVEFANTWMERINPKTQFLLLLLPRHKEKADFIKSLLGDKCIDLTGKANQVEAFAIVKMCKLVLSEDSGLMHMAWIQGIPTVALFSSSRKDWSAPQGERSFCFDSSDMECGPCMREVCKFNDNRCLTRYTPDIVIRHAMTLVEPETLTT